MTPSPATPQNIEVFIGFGLFFLSELIGMSKYKDNSVLQLVLHAASRAFPYELKRRKQIQPSVSERVWPTEQIEPLYSEDELDDLSVQDLRAIARSFGEATLGSKGRRSELVKFLKGIGK